MIRRSQKHSLRICFYAALTLVGAASGACKEDPKPDPGGAASSAALVPSAPAAELKLPGIDTSALLPRERKEFNSYVTEFLSPCAEVAVPISQCITEKRACGSCLTAAKFLLKAATVAESLPLPRLLNGELRVTIRETGEAETPADADTIPRSRPPRKAPELRQYIVPVLSGDEPRKMSCVAGGKHYVRRSGAKGKRLCREDYVDIQVCGIGSRPPLSPRGSPKFRG